MISARFNNRSGMSRAGMLSALIALILGPVTVCGKTAVEWDFSKGTQGWVGNERAKDLSISQGGLIIKSSGQDPWIEGPAVDLPGAKMVRVEIRMKSQADTSGQLFYGRVFREEDSVRFTVQDDGQWHNYKVIIPDKLGVGTRFRIVPCAGEGEITVSFIKVETMGEIHPPTLEKPKKPDKSRGTATSVKSGGLELEHYGDRWGNFGFKVDGIEMAAGYSYELIGLLFGDDQEWVNLENADITFENRSRDELIYKANIEDSKGGKWEIQRRIRAARQEGTLIVETEIKVNDDRDVVYLPWLTIFPGLGTFGEKKYQGLFAGLEYLSDELSSSDADVTTPEHIRRVSDPLKITFPLMAIAYNGNYIGVIWEPSDMAAATFDSPDRIYNSGSHVLALSAPAVGELRLENRFCAHTPFKLEGNKPLKVSMLVIGGKGKTVVDAVKHYVDLKGLPLLPEFEGGFDAAVNLLAHGWLDSKINEDGLFRHAVWGDLFGAGASAEAAMLMDWLANHAGEKTLCERLISGKEQALSRIPEGQPFSSGVSHIHLPTAPFIFGRVGEYVQQRRNEAMSLLNNFDANGIKLYRPGETDYSKTHFEKHANGFSGPDVVRILEAATLSADKELIVKALELLDKQTALYANTVPRGAQTWEVPLHTPDILASAHLVKAYTLGYIITGKGEYLEQARYWGWTGVPFIYLHRPTDGKVGLYATIPVLGATNWTAPVWLGRPVQWCGLVYSSALHLLSECDTKGQWDKIARGITTAGLQMSWPLTDKERSALCGLLPDVFELREQIGAGPAINPGTVQAHLPELYGKGKIYDIKKLQQRNWFIHAPCKISGVVEGQEGVTFITDGWGDKTYYVLICGVEKQPEQVNIRKVQEDSDKFKSAEKEFYKEDGILIIKLMKKTAIQIR